MRTRSGERTLPDFCVVGPVKSGTSDVAVHIMMHPNVIAPFCKEFWDTDPEAWRFFYPTVKEKYRLKQLLGSALSIYCVPNLHSAAVASNMARVQSCNKVVLILRDPIERAYSQWKWEVFLAGKSRLSRHLYLQTFRSYINKALEAYPGTHATVTSTFPVLQTSIYWQAVQNWICCFGAANVLILDVSEYYRDRNPFLQKIQAFLGLPVIAMPYHTKGINGNPLSLPPADDETLSKLTKFFEPHNEQLWDLIGTKYW